MIPALDTLAMHPPEALLIRTACFSLADIDGPIVSFSNLVPFDCQTTHANSAQKHHSDLETSKPMSGHLRLRRTLCRCCAHPATTRELRQMDQVVNRKRLGEPPVDPRRRVFTRPMVSSLRLRRIRLAWQALLAEVRASARGAARHMRLGAEGPAGPY